MSRQVCMFSNRRPFKIAAKCSFTPVSRCHLPTWTLKLCGIFHFSKSEAVLIINSFTKDSITVVASGSFFLIHVAFQTSSFFEVFRLSIHLKCLSYSSFKSTSSLKISVTLLITLNYTFLYMEWMIRIKVKVSVLWFGLSSLCRT